MASKTKVLEFVDADGPFQEKWVDEDAAIASLTDSSGGTPGATLPDCDTITGQTDSTAGTPDDTLADVSTVVTGADGTGSNAALKTDVDARLVSIDLNFANIAKVLAENDTDHGNLATAVASLNAKLDLVLTALRNHGIVAT